MFKAKNKKILSLALLTIFILNAALFAFVGAVKAAGEGNDPAADPSAGILTWLGKIVGTVGEMGFAPVLSGYNTALLLGAKFLAILVYVSKELALKMLTIESIGNMPIVNEGWAISRDIANMFFILILLIISFGTILRIEGWSYEKLLPRFIFAALFINFSKVIALFLIDISQVLTLFFVKLQPDFTTALANTFQLGKFFTFFAFFVVSPVSTFFSLIIEVVFNLLSILAYGILAFLFLVRIVSFWFLIILVPFVWLLGILPKFQSYVNMWWEKFIKWLIFAPAAAFFIYLSTIAMQTTQENLFKFIPAAGDGFIGGLLPDVMQPRNFLSATLAYMFLFGSMAVAQMVSNAAPGLFFGVANKIKGFAQAKAGALAMRKAAPAIEKAVPYVGRIPLVGGAAAEAMMKGAEAPRRQVEEAEKKYEQFSLPHLKTLYMSANAPERAAIMRRLSKEGALFLQGAFDQSQIEKGLELARRYGVEKDVLMARPDLAKDVVERDSIMSKMTPDKIKMLQEEALANSNVLDLLINKYGSSGQAKSILENKSRSFQEKYAAGFDPDIIKQSNPRFAKQISGGKQQDIFDGLGINTEAFKPAEAPKPRSSGS